MQTATVIPIVDPHTGDNRARRGLAEVARLRAVLRQVRDQAETLAEAKRAAREGLEIGMVPLDVDPARRVRQ